MPLYSLIALVLSLFGATYTAISAIRNHFDKAITNALDLVQTQIDVIRTAGADSLRNAEKHGNDLRFWAGVGSGVISSPLSPSAFSRSALQSSVS